MNTALLVAASLAVALVLLRLKVANGPAMAIGALFMALTSGMDLSGMLKAAWAAVTSSQTLTILGAMLLVVTLEDIMSRFGLTDRLMASLGKLIPDKRVHMVILPAFMGLLPSAGGALLSCPMVEKASDGIGLPADKKAFCNFWFRHVMEFIAPVYTALIMLSQLSGRSMGSILRALAPICVVVLVSALPVAFYRTKRMPRPIETNPGGRRRALLDVAVSLSPLAAVLVLVIGFGLSPIVALIPVIFILSAIYRPGAKDLKQMSVKVFNPSVITMVLGIMFYKEVLTASGGITALGQSFLDFGMPKLAMIVALPFATGFLTGMSSATIALTLPILLAMYGADAITPQVAALAYTSCCIGMNLTPTHLCLVLTANYFKVDMIKLIGMMLFPAAATIAAAVLILY